jgi:hypothetical protein
MHKYILYFLLCTPIFAEDIKPTEIKEATFIGVGRNAYHACAEANWRLQASCKQVVGPKNVDVQPLPNGGAITIMTVKYKVVH